MYIYRDYYIHDNNVLKEYKMKKRNKVLVQTRIYCNESFTRINIIQLLWR